MKQYQVDVAVDATLRIFVDADSPEEAKARVEKELRADMLFPDLDYVRVVHTSEA